MTTPISEQFVIDLVDKIRETSKITADELKDLTSAIGTLVESYNHENKELNRNHAELKELIEKQVLTFLKTIDSETKSITKHIRTIIITLVVAFTLLTGAYLLVRNSVEHIVKTQIAITDKKMNDHIEWNKKIEKGLNKAKDLINK